MALINGTELVGCNTDKFDWCASTPPVSSQVYVIAYILIVGASSTSLGKCI